VTFYLIGIDHKVAPIGIREAAYWKRPHIAEQLAKYGAGRAVVLSTCNRFEIYGIAEDRAEAELKIGSLKSRFEPIFNNSYAAYGTKNMLGHLVSLAAGLKSQMIGELEIYGQLGAWALSDGFPKELAALVHDALLSSHDVRMKSGSNHTENNIAVSLYDQILKAHNSDDLLNVVVAGTGKIAGLLAAYRPRDVRICFAAHKNILRAGELAGIAGGRAIFLKDLPQMLLSADVLISATSSPHRVFGKNYFSRIAAVREKDLYIYDLAVPRDVEPVVKDINGMILKNIDEVIQDARIKDRYAAEQIGA